MADLNNYNKPDVSDSRVDVHDTNKGHHTRAITLNPGTATNRPVGAKLAELISNVFTLKHWNGTTYDTWLTISEYMRGLLDDTDAAAARDTLQVESKQEPWQLGNDLAANAITLKLRNGTFGVPSPSVPLRIAVFFDSTSSYNVRSITSELTLTVPQGATLGRTGNIRTLVHVYLLDDSGTMHLAVTSKFIGNNPGLVSTTAISAGSTNPSTVYSATGAAGFLRYLGAFSHSVSGTPGNWTSFDRYFRPDRLPKNYWQRSRNTSNTANNTGAQSIFQIGDVSTYLASFDAISNSNQAPETGDYRLSASLGITGHASVANNVTVQIRVDGVDVATATRLVPANAREVINVSRIVSVNVGASITVRVVTSTANSVTVEVADSYFSGELVSRS